MRAYRDPAPPTRAARRRTGWAAGSPASRRPYSVGVLDVLALAVAAFDVLLALFLTWGLSEEARSGARWKGGIALVLLASTAATAYAVGRALGDGADTWLLVSGVAPLTMLALLVFDRDALWGNFPPSPAMQLAQRVAAVVVFALPGLLAWAAC